jgi:hypothetical protein
VLEEAPTLIVNQVELIGMLAQIVEYAGGMFLFATLVLILRGRRLAGGKQTPALSSETGRSG